MKLLQSTDLQIRWSELMSAATSVDIAVAWVTGTSSVNDLLALSKKPGRRVRVLTGVHDLISDPMCLRKMYAAGILKIGFVKNAIYHPKLYIFEGSGQKTCWVGSANLTCSGFGGNTELVHQFDDDGTAGTWFEQQWQAFLPPTLAWLSEYERRRSASNFGPQSIPQMEPPTTPLNPLESWPAYYAALRAADEQRIAEYDGKYGVFSGDHSYFSTLRKAAELMSADWTVLSKTDARILLGLKDDDESDYGILGSMQPAGNAKNVFLENNGRNLEIRVAIKNALTEVRQVSSVKLLPLMAMKAHEVICNFNGFGAGVATRLLALARPEVLVSVNSKSVKNLSAWTNLSSHSLYTSAGYEKLVRWVLNGQWWKCHEPASEPEREAWKYRGALVDALVYEGDHFAG